MTQIRSSDVFLKADVAGLLRSLALTAQQIATTDSGEFTRGYLVALAAVATGLNIAPADIVPLDSSPATFRY